MAKLHAASAGLLALLLAAGCAAGPAASGDRIGEDPRRDAGRPAPAPLSRADQDILQDAEEELIGACMRARGFQYSAVLPPKVTPRREFPYGNDDVAWARAHGFGLVDPHDTEIDRYLRNHPNERYVDGLSAGKREAYARALTGDFNRQVSVRLPDGSEVFMTMGGCTAEVSQTLYGDPAVRLRLEHTVQLIGSEAHDRVVADRRYLAALAAWRSCMRSGGYSYDSPAAARTAVAMHAEPTTRPSAIETQTASADAECGRRSRLVAIATRLDHQQRAAVSRQLNAEVVAWAELQATAVRRARQLTAGGRPDR